MFNSLRAIKLSAPIPRILLASATALVLTLTLWLALIPVAPSARIIVAAPNDDPIGGLTATNTSPSLVNTPISFTAAVTGGTNITYTWDFGDNSSGSEITPTHAYTASGLFTATVVAVNDSDTQTATTTVYVGDAVVDVADFQFDPKDVTIPLGGHVVWIYKGTLSHSVTSDVDGDFEQPLGTDWDPFIQGFSSAGLVRYHCSFHGGDNGSGMSGTVDVQAPPEPIDDLSATNDGPAKVNTLIQFSGIVTGGTNITYTWDFDDGSSESDLSEITTTHSYTAPGIYTATVTASNISSTLVATTTAYVGDEIIDVKDNFYAPTPITVQPGATVIWVYDGEHSHSVTADDGSFNRLAGKNWAPFVHTFDSPVASIAAVDATNVTYHCTIHANMTGTVTIATPPPAIGGLQAANSGPVELPAPISFTATITGGTEISYTWDFDDGNTSTTTDDHVTHVYTHSGVYSVTVVATNATNTMTATTEAMAGDAIVQVVDNKFIPDDVHVPIGGLVIWVLGNVNNSHGVVSTDNPVLFQSPETGTDWSPYAHVFEARSGEGPPYVYPYICTVHGFAMPGNVIVGEGLLLPRVGKGE